MRYNLATLAELRVFEPLPYTLELDGERAAARRDAGRGRQRPVVRRRAADHRGRLARRRAARRGDHQADEQARPGPDLPEAVQRHAHHATRSTSTTGSASVTVAAPGHRRRTPTASGSAPLPLTVDVAPAGARRCWCRRSIDAELPVRAVRAVPARAAARRCFADFAALYDFDARRLPGRGPARRSRPATACWSPRPPAPARRSSASSPCTWRWHQGRKCFYTTPIKALSNQKFADLVGATAPTRSACSPATTPSTARRRSW